jgi:hypothetical protein
MYFRFESRVLFSDSVNGESFNFAIKYGTPNRARAIDMAREDFPDSEIVEVTHVRVEE